MKFQYRLLGRTRRSRVREIARTAWADCQADPEKAEDLATMRINDQFYGFVSSILISLAIKLAIELIKHWAMQLLAEPPTQFVAGEPGSHITKEAEE